MFIVEDPGRRGSVRSRELQASRAKAHASAIYHRSRRARQLREIQKQDFEALDSSPKKNDLNIIDPSCNGNGERNAAAVETGPLVSWSNISSVTALQRNRNQTPLIPPSLANFDLRDRGRLREGRSLQFFIERTAIDWPGWYDVHFWRVLSLQASTVHPCIRHGLISLAAYHEALEEKDRDRSNETRTYSFKQGQKAVSLLMEEHNRMSMGTLLSAQVVIAAFSAFFDDRVYFQALQVQHQLRDQIRESHASNSCHLSASDQHYISHYLDPIIERQRSRNGQLIDMLLCLRRTDSAHFFDPEPLTIPATFTSLLQARLLLERLLKWTTYIVKSTDMPINTVPKDADTHLLTWLLALEQFANAHKLPDKDKLSISILRAAAKISFMMIKTMNVDDEMVFDEFTADYRELADVFMKITAYNASTSRTDVNFGIENGLMTLLGNTAMRWSRDPKIRQDIIDTFAATSRREAMEGALVWADVTGLTKRLEEEGIDPPPTSCHDIPASNRVRVNFSSFYFKSRVQRVQFLRPPYRETDVEDYWIPHSGCGTMTYLDAGTAPAEFNDYDNPDMILGRGYTSLVRSDGGEGYYTTKDPKFYFNIPRV